MIEFIQQGEQVLVKGRLTQIDVCQLWPSKETCLSAQIKVLDLSQLSYSDSAGVAFLVLLWRQAQQQGQVIRFQAIPAQLQQLIALYELQSVFHR